MSNFGDVGQFHHRFGLPSVIHDGGPRQPEPSEELDKIMDLRVARMEEELQEFADAYNARDQAKMADALVDLAYVVMGTAHILGYPWEAIWREVHEANMRKQRAKTNGEDSRHGSGYDVIKPEGWEAPDVELVLKRYGFNV